MDNRMLVDREDLVRTVGIGLRDGHREALDRWAQENRLFNGAGHPNRSRAVQRLIEIVCQQEQLAETSTGEQ